MRRARSQAQGHREQRQGAKLSARLGSFPPRSGCGSLLTLRPAETEAMETVLILPPTAFTTQLLVCPEDRELKKLYFSYSFAVRLLNENEFLSTN